MSLPSGCCPPVGRASCSEKAGIASVPSTPTTARIATIGAFTTRATQRSPSVGWWFGTSSPEDSASAARARAATRERGRGARRFFRSPITAGSRVRAASIAVMTDRAAATPITPRNGMPTTSSPASAMTTVIAANTTEPPAVATEVAADSSASMPFASCCRCRLRMNRA